MQFGRRILAVLYLVADFAIDSAVVVESDAAAAAVFAVIAVPALVVVWAAASSPYSPHRASFASANAATAYSEVRCSSLLSHWHYW